MFSRLKNLNTLLITAYIPGVRTVIKDEIDPNTETAKKMAAEARNKVETGWDRLYIMFTLDEFKQPSPEIVNTSHVMMMSAFVGGAIGGFIHSKTAFLNFVERNDATSFTTHMDAKQRLQDKVTVGFGKGAWMWGSRLTAFTGTYTLTSAAISAYRGENGIIEHVIAGMITGVLYKLNLGIRGIVVGGCLGTVLGTFAGVSTWGLLKLTGKTMDDVRKTSYWVKREREALFQKAVDDYVALKEDELLKGRDERMGVTNDKIDVIPEAKKEEKKTQ